MRAELDDGDRDDLQSLPPARSRSRSSSSSTRRSCPRSSSRPGASVDTSDEPEALRLTDHHELDLEPLIRDAIQLAEPIAPVCRPDCPGLCEVCGADLSEPGHVAHEAPIDPRLEVLRAFAVDGSTETD